MPRTSRGIKVTPWTQTTELITLKHAFFSNVDQERQRAAIETVRAWEIRGRVPHAVVATAELTNALLFHRTNGGTSIWERSGVFMSAWTRFVDGITDTQQTFRVKRNMYEIARAIGMPKWFVDLRHRCVHEGRPLLNEFVMAVNRGLEWLFTWFWAHLKDGEETRERKGRDESGKEVIESTAHQEREVRSAWRQKVEEYLDERRQQSGTRKGNIGATKAVESFADSAAQACADDDDKSRGLVQCIILDFTAAEPETGLKRKRSSQKVKHSDRFPTELEQVALAISRALPSFALVLDEVLRVTVTAPTDNESDGVRSAAVALLTRMYVHEDWQDVVDFGLLDMDALQELCHEHKNQWTERLLESLSTGD